MKRLPWLFLFFAISNTVFSQTSTKAPPLHFDGYYHTLSDTLNPFRYYLRFYPDGTVIGISTAGNPRNLIPWFKKGHQTVSQGQYEVKDSTISFAMKSAEGEVVYSGKLLPQDRLFLHVKSKINKYEGREEYFFWKIEGLK